MIIAISASLTGGVGAVKLAGNVVHRWPGRARWIMVPLVVLVGVGSAARLAQRMYFDSAPFVTYSQDDEQALRWLRTHTQPGDVVANDGGADAGIWAPYKADSIILLPRMLHVDGLEAREFVRSHVGVLERTPGAQETACGLGIRYVYVGSGDALYEARQFPGVDALRQSSALGEVFNQGGAAIFRLKCPN